ncbi:hypothetical protein [Amnimonas aquatica]|uniref:Uncharacterized protein n=1 Tax=Amnimonas aquatica TaxID=2094561 RepID=A0A2P6AUD7_9GAMM|nr:hypothetical protein [Amnimonas aquatica]PQA50054.1 hypothetical protein C5O18_02005 [Amnimonas aquatica]
MGELKNFVASQQDVVVRVKEAGRQVALAGLGLVEVLKVEGEKLQAVDFNAKAEELKAKALELKTKLQGVDVKAEAEKLQAVDFKAKAEELKTKLQGVDAKAEVEKLLAEAQKLFADLVAKGENRAA